MKKNAMALIILFALIILLTRSVSYSMASEVSQVEDVPGIDAGALDLDDVNFLIAQIQTLIRSYRISDGDASVILMSTENLLKSINNFVIRVKAAGPDDIIPLPSGELKNYFTMLSMFLDKYNISAEDLLGVGEKLNTVAIGAVKMADTDEIAKSIVSKSDYIGVFTELGKFAQKHHIKAVDLLFILQNLCDIGLTIMQNGVTIKQMRDSGGSWRNQLSKGGVSKEQADALYDNLKAFKHKYNISTLELLKLYLKINKLLKGDSKSPPKD